MVAGWWRGGRPAAEMAGRHSLNKILLTKDSVYNSKSYLVCTLFVGCKGVVLCVAGAELRTTCRLRTTVRGSMA